MIMIELSIVGDEEVSIKIAPSVGLLVAAVIVSRRTVLLIVDNWLIELDVVSDDRIGEVVAEMVVPDVMEAVEEVERLLRLGKIILPGHHWLVQPATAIESSVGCDYRAFLPTHPAGQLV